MKTTTPENCIILNHGSGAYVSYIGSDGEIRDGEQEDATIYTRAEAEETVAALGRGYTIMPAELKADEDQGTIDNTKADNFVGLDTYLTANRNYQVLTATLGTNGDGGQFADCEELIEAGIEDYQPVAFESSELQQHLKDAGGEGAGSPEDFLAYEKHEMDDNGYQTGAISRIYIDLQA